MWLLPRDPTDQSKALLAFNDQFFTTTYKLPTWWTQEYSEQYANIPKERVFDFIDSFYEEGMKTTTIQTAVAQKFRLILTKEEITNYIKSL